MGQAFGSNFQESRLTTIWMFFFFSYPYATSEYIQLRDRPQKVWNSARLLKLWFAESGLHAVLWSHIGILMLLPAAEPHSSTGLLFPSQNLSGAIWLTPYSMVWDWRVSRVGSIPFYSPSCSLLFCPQLFSLSLLFLYRLVVWGWGLRTDRVSIYLSRPCIANLF